MSSELVSRLDKRTAIIIILVCNAILISLLELIIPVPIPIPGVKLGLGNIITIIAIAFLDLKAVLIIVLLRSLVVAVLSKGILMLAFSLSGGILSALIMWLLYKNLSTIFSIKGISIVGALVHNTAQVMVASLILREMILLYYLPILLVSSVFTGFITGSISDLSVREISKGELLSDSAKVIGSRKMQPRLPDIKTTSCLAKLDAGLKAFLAMGLTVLAVVCETPVSLFLVFLYLVVATLLLGSNLRFLLKNLLSYALVFLIPYSFGLLLSIFLGYLFPNALSSSDLVSQDTFIRMVRIFFVWYIGSLYITSTPLKSILGMLKQVFSPLNRLGVPISNYLAMIMCIVINLTESVSDFKTNAVEQTRTIFKDKSLGFKAKLMELSYLLVFYISNSFKKTDQIRRLMDRTDLFDFTYRSKVGRHELLAIVSFVVLLTAVYF